MNTLLARTLCFLFFCISLASADCWEHLNKADGNCVIGTTYNPSKFLHGKVRGGPEQYARVYVFNNQCKTVYEDDVRRNYLASTRTDESLSLEDNSDRVLSLTGMPSSLTITAFVMDSHRHENNFQGCYGGKCYQYDLRPTVGQHVSDKCHCDCFGMPIKSDVNCYCKCPFTC